MFCFFSSRRRHTRFDCDWSSDVCSSDLARRQATATPPGVAGTAGTRRLISLDPSPQTLVEVPTMLSKLLVAALGVSLMAINPVAAQTPKEINFGILSTESSQNLKQDWQPVIDDMSSRLGVKVNAFFAPDYAGVIE